MAASAESDIQVSDSENEFLECGLCYENDDLKRLPWPGHIYCVSCLTRDSADTSIVQCPACRRVFDGGVDAIPSTSATLDRKMCCDVCLRKEEKLKLAQMYCVICQKKFCDLYMKSHNDALDDHRRIPMSEYQKEYRCLEIRYCPEHSDQMYSAACTKCYHVFCVNCLMDSGRCDDDGSTHNFFPLDKLVLDLTGKINDRKLWIFDKEESLLGIVKEMTGSVSNWDKETNEMVEQLHQARDNRLADIRKRYDDLEFQLLNCRTQAKAELNIFLGSEFDAKLSRIGRGVKKIDFRLFTQHYVDVIKGFRETEKLVNSLQDITIPKFEKSANFIKLTKRDVEIPEALSVELVTGDIMSTHASPTQPTSLTLLKEVQVPGRPIALDHVNTAIYVGLNSRQVVRRSNDSQISEPVFEEAEPILSLLIHDDLLYILLRGKVIVRTLDGQKMHTWSVPTQGWTFPKMRIVKRQVVIPDTKNKALEVFSTSGRTLKTIPCTFCEGPVAMASFGENSVILSEPRSNTVARVDIDTGKVMWTSDHVQKPQGVVCYKEKYVLVTNKNNTSRIWILDVETGKFLGEMYDKETKESSAFDMHVSGNTLIIAKSESECIQYYRLG